MSETHNALPELVEVLPRHRRIESVGFQSI